MQSFLLKSLLRLKAKVELSFPYLQAESSKKNTSSKEEVHFNISELSGTIVKQGFLMKQVSMVLEPALEHKEQHSSWGFLESKCDLYNDGWTDVPSRANLPVST